MRRFAPVLLVVALLGVQPGPAAATPPEECVFGDAPGGDETLTHAFDGGFGDDLEGAYVMVPFVVPEDTTQVRVRLCYTQPHDAPFIQNTLDLGVWDARGANGDFLTTDGFRGWGGSSRPDVTISPNDATPGFMPGETPAGTWAAEIGVAAIVKSHEGNPSGEVPWRLEVWLSEDEQHADEPWEPAGYNATPVTTEPGWYKGDFHVHAEHSGSAPMRQTFDFAFDVAELDFLTLTDYVVERHWHEVGRFQGDYPDNLIVRSAEIITYRGHVVNHASLRYVDHRTGPVYELDADGSLTRLREERPASELFKPIGDAGGWTQVAHPTTFPSTVPGFDKVCRGCSWEYTDEETDWSLVDAMEVQTGPSGWAGHEPATHQQVAPLDGNEPGPNPFTPLAVEWWDRLRREGHRITAVGSSDSHRAGEQSVLWSPIGHPTTVVYAEELSEQGIGNAIRAGHAYIKFFASDGPDLRWEARLDPKTDDPDAIMGDIVEADAVHFTARVLAALPTGETPQARTLIVMRDGIPLLSVPVTDDPFELSFPATVPGDYRLQLQRGTAIEGLTNPITLEAR